MKASIFRVFLTMIATAVCALPSARAADTTAASNQPAADTGVVATPAQPAAPAVTQTPAPAPVKLPYGVEDVLKLSRAQISEDVVVNYIHNSGTVYNLEPNDIVYLRNQGVSDRVLNAMMEQRNRTTALAQTVQPAPVPVAPTPDPNAAAQYPQPAPTYVQAPTDAQPASGSSLYVIPYPAATTAYYGSYAPYGSYGYYGYYPYYYPYYRGYCGPVVSFGFGYHGGHGWYHGGGYHGGYHGHH